MEKKESRRKRLIQKLKTKYRLVILDDESFKERFSFRLSRLNVFVVAGTIAILLIIATTFIIAFTPLREYIPGYPDVSIKKDLRELAIRTDSLEKAIRQKDLYIHNIKNIMEGKPTVDEIPQQLEKKMSYDTVHLYKSKDDTLLRERVETEGKYNILMDEYQQTISQGIKTLTFFTPIKGLITNGFNAANDHYGIDIVAPENEVIKATLDGTIIVATWTLETGFIIGIQHADNFVSFYKHNSVLLKKQGDFVKAGDPIAIIGGSGEFSTGIHLHFELWYNGNPVDPKDYISF